MDNKKKQQHKTRKVKRFYSVVQRTSYYEELADKAIQEETVTTEFSVEYTELRFD